MMNQFTTNARFINVRVYSINAKHEVIKNYQMLHFAKYCLSRK